MIFIGVLKCVLNGCPEVTFIAVLKCPVIISYADLSCDDLIPPSNGRVKFTGTFPGSMATYSCNSVYTLVGPSIRVCLYSGQWSSKAPVCERRVCALLTALVNGEIRYSSFNRVNSVVTYRCDHGFVLVGRGSRTCGSNGVWSGAKPSCRKQRKFL